MPDRSKDGLGRTDAGRFLRSSAAAEPRPASAHNKIRRGCPRPEAALKPSSVAPVPLEQFAPSASGDLRAAMHHIAELGVRHVLATDGCHGALMLADGRIEPVPAFLVREVDATGAGDVFLAGFLAACHGLGEPARDAARFGAAAASFVVEGPGASRLGNLAEVMARRAALATE